MQKLLPKKELNGFLKKLIAKYEVIAPVNIGISKFQKINHPEQVYLEKITKVPAKKIFIPDNENILTNNKEKTNIIFGLRICDLNAIQILDKVMYDQNYKQKRADSILIGISCNNPDEFCFCNSMDLNKDCFDLFFHEDKNNYYISIGSEKGKELVKNLKDSNKEIINKEKNTLELKNKDIEKDYKNNIWKTDSEKCLSCSACTVYCPTCNCYDIKDSNDINSKNPQRTRSEMSCMLKSFSRVAGGKVFRDSRLSRYKHFVYHKIVYYNKRFSRYMCVGCGRCLRVCPTKINWVNTINLLKEIK